MSGGITQVHGVVRDPSGREVPEAVVSIVESSTPMPESALRADGAGKFVRGVPAGKFVLEAVDPGSGRRGRATIQAAAGTECVNLVITLDP
jgi:hypothetical protein